jgi:glycosyltransferase involved in cell wall biosynthesis
MQKIILDMTKLTNLNCGLGQVSLNYARTLVNAFPENLQLNFLVKPGQKNIWGKPVSMHYTNLLRRYFHSLNSSFDIWHAIHQDSAFLPAIGKTKFILTIHDLNFLREKSADKIEQRLLKLQRKIDRADVLCYISEYAKNTTESNLNTKNKPSHVIYNGLPDFPPQSQKPKIAPEEKFFFNVGVIKPKKNHAAIIRMMSFLPEYQLIIAGDGDKQYLDELKQLIISRGLENRVQFAGGITDEEKLWYFKNAQALVFPSIAEGFGLPVIEAMSQGLPVICSDFGGLKEIGGKYARYWSDFNPETMAETVRNTILEFSVFPNSVAEIKNYAMQFSWEKNVQQYLQIYTDLL